ncbi:hypothetical protein TRFO_01851 [Tritrichomonas foetus]|uniref:Uncharacterized protein n=1 Tax=Tritrichomonas foetus TaxID=1144522 RepID=A0A1J4JK84_9EUKA|nr:hypothetical protein TRFO_01851 [Tritrichomonas foetus]|eukprot:OHS98799.1 hypothetical protein TRFO_01851 [Tritrichomonas foetus]
MDDRGRRRHINSISPSHAPPEILNVGDIVISRGPLYGIRLKILEVENKVVTASFLNCPIIGKMNDFVKIPEGSAFLIDNDDVLGENNTPKPPVHYKTRSVQCTRLIPEASPPPTIFPINNYRVGDFVVLKNDQIVIVMALKDDQYDVMDFQNTSFLIRPDEIVDNLPHDNSCVDHRKNRIFVGDMVSTRSGSEGKVLATFDHHVLFFENDNYPVFLDDNDVILINDNIPQPNSYHTPNRSNNNTNNHNNNNFSGNNNRRYSPPGYDDSGYNNPGLRNEFIGPGNRNDQNSPGNRNDYSNYSRGEYSTQHGNNEYGPNSNYNNTNIPPNYPPKINPNINSNGNPNMNMNNNRGYSDYHEYNTPGRGGYGMNDPRMNPSQPIETGSYRGNINSDHSQTNNNHLPILSNSEMRPIPPNLGNTQKRVLPKWAKKSVIVNVPDNPTDAVISSAKNDKVKVQFIKGDNLSFQSYEYQISDVKLKPYKVNDFVVVFDYRNKGKDLVGKVVAIGNEFVTILPEKAKDTVKIDLDQAFTYFNWQLSDDIIF